MRKKYCLAALKIYSRKGRKVFPGILFYICALREIKHLYSRVPSAKTENELTFSTKLRKAELALIIITLK